MENNNTGWTLAVVFIFAYIIVMLYNMAKIDAYNPVVTFGMLAFIIGLTLANIWGDIFSFIRAPPEFVTLSGLGGRLVGGPYSLPGGLMKAKVVFNRSYVPENLRDRGPGGFVSVLSSSLGSKVIEVIGDYTQFHKVDARDCENPNGCWVFLGKLDGSELQDKEVLYGTIQNRVLQDKIGALVTSLRIYGQELSMLVNQRHLDDEETANRYKVLADNMKNVKIISKGAGGGAAETIAAELD